MLVRDMIESDLKFFWIDTEFLQQDFANIYIHLAKNCMFLHKIMFKLIQRTWNMNDIFYV